MPTAADTPTPRACGYCQKDLADPRLGWVAGIRRVEDKTGTHWENVMVHQECRDPYYTTHGIVKVTRFPILEMTQPPLPPVVEPTLATDAPVVM